MFVGKGKVMCLRSYTAPLRRVGESGTTAPCVFHLPSGLGKGGGWSA